MKAIIPDWRKRDLPAVALAGLLVLVWKISLVSLVVTMGDADACGYAGMARSLLAGQGLQANHVGTFFEIFPRVPHPADHWPPLYAFMIVPFFALWGESALAAKLPSMIVACLGLPIAVQLLTRQLSGQRWAGVGAGLTVLLQPAIFRWSLFALTDVTFAFLIVVAAYFAVRAVRAPRFCYPAGIALGIAYYAKTTSLIVLPVFFAFHLMATKRWFRFWREPHALGGVAAMVLTMTPWWIRNFVHFGTTKQVVYSQLASVMASSNVEPYRILWNDPVPSLVATLLAQEPKALFAKVWGTLWFQLQACFVRYAPMLDDFPEGSTDGYPVYLGVPMWLISLGLLGLFLKKGRDRRVWIIPFIVFTCIAILAVCWLGRGRYLIPHVALLIALGWTGFAAMTRYLHPKARCWIAVLAILAAMMVSGRDCWRMVRHGQKHSEYPFADEPASLARLEAMNWMREHLPPDAVVMDNEPWQLGYLAERIAVRLPAEDLDGIVLVMKQYGVTHITSYLLRGQKQTLAMRPLFSAGHPALKHMQEFQRWHIYEVDPNRLEP